jgi:L-2,4-diaminobutyrate decarboxylase
MKIQPRAHKDVLRKLWHPATVRKLGRELSDIAAKSLLVEDGPVRKPGASQFAAKIVRARTRNTNLTDLVREIQRASLQLSHPRYIAQQVAAPIPAAALVESVVAAMNQSLAAWEMSPIATAIDRDLISRFKKLFGYPQKAEGSLVPGGAFSNLTALLAAREWLEPGASKRGGARIALIAGAQSHYSVSRSAAILGLGTDAVFRVPLNPEFATDIARVPEAFAAARKAGFRKFILIGSSGSTPTGSFDDLVALRKIATQQRAWFHVDAAHGGGIAFSHRFRKRLWGLGEADSITFDPHKMMFMPLSAGGVLVRDGARLVKPLQDQAPYLFGPRRRWPDIGQVTIACSQRFDALKVWLLWRAYGPQLWDVLTTHACEVAQAAFQYCAQSEVLRAAHEPHSNILCFYLQHASGPDADRQLWAIKEELNESGFGYLSSTVLDGRRVLRLVVMNPRTTVADVHDLLGRVEQIAKRRGTLGAAHRA